MQASLRLLWALNHRTLMPDEVGILRSLGWAVFTPRILPHGLDARSTALEDRPDDTALALPPEVLHLLTAHPFYDRPWSPTLALVINRHFDVVVSAFYKASFVSAVRYFKGTVIARAFGRVGTAPYHDLSRDWQDPGLDRTTADRGERFLFGQAYDALAEVEPRLFADRAVTLPVPVPGWSRRAAGAWTGDVAQALFLCPVITGNPYYGSIHRTIKEHFGDLPHVIFGRQAGPVSDPQVLPAPDDDALLALYSRSRVFLYPTREPRHLHYSPLEAMTVGAPVLYLKGSLLDREAGGDLPGACEDLAEMRSKARALLAGDVALAAGIRAAQPRILARFSREAARSAWQQVLEHVPARRCA